MASKRPDVKSPAPRKARASKAVLPPETRTYEHPEAKTLLRPDVGTQASFRKKKPPQTYRYDSSLAPALSWDGQNTVRELGEWLLGLIEEASKLDRPHEFAEPRRTSLAGRSFEVRGLRDAAAQLKALSGPFLDWAGKAERLSFDVPTLPLFVHERLSTKGILETLKGHKRDRQMSLADLFSDPQHSVTDLVLKAYEYKDDWTNRMVLGDSLVVMNSLLHYEGLGGQVQMIYMDPPYGVKFGSNFQPFVRKRDVRHNDDEDLTREPEMVKAYRDTWELGLHSYLTYMRDRLLLARDLLTPSGSIFVQISDENLHHVRELMDEVFGADNYVALINFEKTSGSTTKTIQVVSDYLLWYARDSPRLKARKLFTPRRLGAEGAREYRRVDLEDGSIRPLSEFMEAGRLDLPPGARVFATDSIVSKGGDDPDIDLESEGSSYRLSCRPNRHWKAGVEGTRRLWDRGRLLRQEGLRIYERYFNDFPYNELTHVWSDTRGEADFYVVQTSPTVVERCLLMTTDPGDVVLDPTCGSGTTAVVSERWGRRWITIDTSRVPLALARQRLLTATYPYFELKDATRGPAGGLEYRDAGSTRNPVAVGPGIVPHVYLESVAHDLPPPHELLVDRPEVETKIARVTGPFCVEATIPTPVDWEGDGIEDSDAGESYGSFVERMLEVLRRSPVLHVGGGKTVTLSRIRPPAKSLSLSAEAVVEPQAVAIVFGPENGAISEKLVYEAAREAHAKSYSHLYVIGFAIQPVARTLVDNCEAVAGTPATYVQATPDLMMGELLKNMRSSQIFSVCGLPEVRLRRAKGGKDEPGTRQPARARPHRERDAESVSRGPATPATGLRAGPRADARLR